MSLLASCSPIDGTVKIWEFETYELLNTLFLDKVEKASFSPDNTKIICNTCLFNNSTVKLFTLEGECLFTLNDLNNIYSISFSNDGNRIIIFEYNRSVKVFSLEGILLNILNTEFRSASFNQDKIITCSNNGVVNILSLYFELLNTFTFDDYDLQLILFSPDFSVLALLYNKSIEILDSESGDVLVIFNEEVDNLELIKFSKDGKNIISTSVEMNFKVWSLETFELLCCISYHENCMFEALFTLDSDKIITLDEEYCVKVFSLRGELLYYFNIPREYYIGIFSLRGYNYFLTRTSNKEIKLYSLEGELIHTIETNQNNVSLVNVSYQEVGSYI